VYKTGDLPEAAQVFEDALTELDGREPDRAEQLEARLINVCLAVPSLRSRVVDRVIPLMMNNSRVTDPVLLAGLAMATTAAIPPAVRGAELAERALAGGRLSAEEDPAVFVSAGIALMGAGRLDRAKSLWDQVIADARRRGSIPTLSLGWALRAFVLVRMGAIAAAEADAQGALERLDVELLFPLPLIVSPLIDVHLERGQPEAASELLEEHDLGGELPDLAPANFLLESVLGRLRIAQNRSSEGIAALRACGRRLEASGVRNPGLISWRSSLAPALAAAGERGQALALTREEVELARAFDVPRELGMALRAAGLVEGGAAGIDLLREAVAVLRASPARLEHARALTDLGAALRRKGQRSDAREPLRAGLDLAQRCGATALAHLAHGELVATGARPRRLVLSGVDALTASERRVAEMAAEGLTNRQIAQALFVAEKTVQGHLGHAYRKLDITSRSELPDALQS
jgi:DNA-binding CsgD family transcriptional regulator